MNRSFEIIASLQYELKGAQRELASFKSGQKYVTMKKDHESELRHLERSNRELRKELHDTRYEQTRARQLWYESSDDMRAVFWSSFFCNISGLFLNQLLGAVYRSFLLKSRVFHCFATSP